jgi:mannosyltransferase OCH1-like enzyme
MKNWPLFDESMKYSSQYNNQKTNDDQWDKLKAIYDTVKIRPKQSQKIPKLIHQIWLGDAMPQFEFNLTTHLRKSLNSEWIYKLWTEKDIKCIENFTNINYYYQTSNFGQKSDLLRYAILYQFGGIYMDTDFQLNTSFDELLDLDFFCGVAYDKTPVMFNGLIGSSAKNNLITDLTYLDKPLMCEGSTQIMDSTGPYFLTRKFFKHIETMQNIAVLPNSFFYPYPNFTFDKINGNDHNKYVTDNTICTHLWSSRW